MLGGRLKRLAFWRRGGANDSEQPTKNAELKAPVSSESKASKPSKPKKSKSSVEPTRGVTLRIPSWFLRGLAALGVLAVVGFGVWYFAIRDTGPSAAEK